MKDTDKRVESPEQVRIALADVRGEVRLAEPMSRHTSMRVGGAADAVVIPQDEQDLKVLLAGAFQQGISVFALGGSNLIVRDGGIRGIVVKLSHLQSVRREGLHLHAQAGIAFPKLSQTALSHGLSGLEFAAGIPGTLGGAIVMNAGTGEGEIAQVLHSVKMLDLEGHEKVFDREALFFEYRSSKLPAGMIVAAEMLLKEGDAAEIKQRMDASLKRRRETQPLQYANAGCIFKNPPGEAAGRLVEQLGLKGRRVGEAEVSPLHGNFIVNRGKATAQEVLDLIREVQEQVKAARGIEMELEVKVVGEA